MDLMEIYKEYESLSDKGTVHSFAQNFYQHDLKKYRDRENVIVEIGVLLGGSIMLFHDYFQNSQIYALDIKVSNVDFEKWCEDKPRVKYIIDDGYKDSVVSQIPNIDIFIDDGPHTLESQLLCLEKYLPKMNKGGLFIIEDIQTDDDMNSLFNATPDDLKPYVTMPDFRSDRGRYDDRLFVIKLPE